MEGLAEHGKGRADGDSFGGHRANLSTGFLVQLSSRGALCVKPQTAKRPFDRFIDYLASLAGLEPTTRCLEGSRSIQLSYRDALGQAWNQCSNGSNLGQGSGAASHEPPRSAASAAVDQSTLVLTRCSVNRPAMRRLIPVMRRSSTSARVVKCL